MAKKTRNSVPVTDGTCPTTPKSAMKSRKRKRSEEKDKSCTWGSVNIREYEIEVFGGGGVPTEGGPALGLSWNVVAEQRRDLVKYDKERCNVRSPKESYMEDKWLGPEKRRKILKEAGIDNINIGQMEEVVNQTLLSRHESNFYLGQEGHWLFDVDTVAAAADAAADLGFEANEIVELHAEDAWHKKANIVKDIATALGEANSPGPKPSKAKKQKVDKKEREDEGDATWLWVQDLLRKHVEKDMLIYVVCPSDEATEAGGTHQRSFENQVNKSRRNIARLVDCVAQTWHEEAEAGTEIGNAAVLLQGWGDDILSVQWNSQEVSNYHVEMVGW